MISVHIRRSWGLFNIDKIEDSGYEHLQVERWAASTNCLCYATVRMEQILDEYAQAHCKVKKVGRIRWWSRLLLPGQEPSIDLSPG